jgi:hypothetical protein
VLCWRFGAKHKANDITGCSKTQGNRRRAPTGGMCGNTVTYRNSGDQYGYNWKDHCGVVRPVLGQRGQYQGREQAEAKTERRGSARERRQWVTSKKSILPSTARLPGAVPV